MTAACSSFDLQSAILNLFKSAYVSNLHIEGEELSAEEAATLPTLSPLEILENINELLSDLLAFKRNYWTMDHAKLLRQRNQFETMLQKLESEVRGHIRVEQQLKLRLEEAQNRVEELEKRVDDRGKGERTGQTQAKGFSLEDKRHARKGSDINKRSDSPERRSKLLSSLESNCDRLKLALDSKTKELTNLRRDYERLLKDTILRKVKLRESENCSRKSPTRSPLSDEGNQRKAVCDVEKLFRKRYEVSPYRYEGGKEMRRRKGGERTGRRDSTGTG